MHKNPQHGQPGVGGKAAYPSRQIHPALGVRHGTVGGGGFPNILCLQRDDDGSGTSVFVIARHGGHALQIEVNVLGELEHVLQPGRTKRFGSIPGRDLLTGAVGIVDRVDELLGALANELDIVRGSLGVEALRFRQLFGFQSLVNIGKRYSNQGGRGNVRVLRHNRAEMSPSRGDTTGEEETKRLKPLGLVGITVEGDAVKESEGSDGLTLRPRTHWW